MDSTNNGSLQSSSGGGADDLDFDSHSFTNINNTTINLSMSNRNNNNNHQNNSTTNTPYFDPLSFLSPTTPAPTPTPHQKTPTPKNPKKRTRASRRAPTTVLTTDTSNFRQMVQEFTGIPAPPFSAPSSSSTRPRFDFFNHPGVKFQFPIFHASRDASTTTSSNPTSGSTIMINPALPTFNYQQQLPPPPQSSSNIPPGPDFQSLLAAGADYGVDGHVSGLPGFIGSGWGQDVDGDPTRLRG